MTDYLKFWQIEEPVYLSPRQPGELYLPDRLNKTFSEIKNLCLTSIPLITVVGASGSGKTTLLKWLYDAIPVKQADVILGTVALPEQSPGWLIPQVGKFLGVHTHSLTEIVKRLFDLREEKRKLVIMIDSAHLIQTTEACSEIISLLSIADLAGSHLTFILAGRSSLDSLVESTPELKTRVGLQVSLEPWTEDEALTYLNARGKAANLNFEFTQALVAEITLKAGGIPAVINQEAEKILMQAAQSQEKKPSLVISSKKAPPKATPEKNIDPQPSTSKTVKLSSLFQRPGQSDKE